ncbi:MAG: VOC family protein [Chloroflexi bacterium]|nr:VOC family protein [Chloroflexota bacterium]MBV9595715.1 VOC family protein [Chloroflexota bacterium]
MTAAPSIQRLDHWTLVTSDVDRTRNFYSEVLGAKVPKRSGGPASVNLAGTVIDFFPASADQPPSPGGWGQHHAYIIDLQDYDGWVEHFSQKGVAYHRTTHGLHRMSIYVDDPDGYHIELTVPFEDEQTGRREIEKRGLLQ